MRGRPDQRHQRAIGAVADPLQHDAADRDVGRGAALRQRLVTGGIETGFAEIVQAGQRPRRLVGCDQQSVGGEGGGGTRRALDQPLQALGERHDPAAGVERRNQDAMAAVRQVDAPAATGREHAGGRAESTQPLQADRTVGAEAGTEAGDLAAVRIGRTEDVLGQFSAVRGTEYLRADRVGPDDPRAIGRP